MIDTSINITAAALPYVSRHRFSGKRPDAYAKTLEQDYKMMLPFLPDSVESILDVGCGMAGIDILLKRHYPAASLWLLDGDGAEKRDGWNETLNAFSSRTAADELLAANGVKADCWIDVNTSELLKAELIISLASLGYHYPLSTYRLNGLCIMDLRDLSEPVRGRVIFKGKKFSRCVFEMSQ